MPLPIKAILFDHDGTLVDSEPTHFQLWAEVLRPYQVSLSEEQYKLHYAGVPTVANATASAKPAPSTNRWLTNAINSDSKKRRSFVAPLFAAGYGERWASTETTG